MELNLPLCWLWYVIFRQASVCVGVTELLKSFQNLFDVQSKEEKTHQKTPTVIIPILQLLEIEIER